MFHSCVNVVLAGVCELTLLSPSFTTFTHASVVMSMDKETKQSITTRPLSVSTTEVSTTVPTPIQATNENSQSSSDSAGTAIGVATGALTVVMLLAAVGVVIGILVVRRKSPRKYSVQQQNTLELANPVYEGMHAITE